MEPARRALLLSALGLVCLAATGQTSSPAATPDPAPTRWPPAARSAPVPDDAPAAREATKARLRAAAPGDVCKDASRGSRPCGTTCASREFNAPPRLEAPRLRWSLEPG